MICKICNQKSKQIFIEKILNKYDVKYFHCENCSFLQTEEPYWLDEAYKDSINISDTGYVQRNIEFTKHLSLILILLFKKDRSFLDYAGGYGVFVRMMRDVGFDFYWDDKFTENLFAKGFEHKLYSKYEVVTSFESFEHFVNPITEIEKLLDLSKNIIFSTEVLPNPIPKPVNWWYYGFNHGQHISFFSEKTLYFIANKFQLNYLNLGNLHILSKKRLPFYSKYILNFNKYGIRNILLKRMKSKTWEDHLKLIG